MVRALLRAGGPNWLYLMLLATSRSGAESLGGCEITGLFLRYAEGIDNYGLVTSSGVLQERSGARQRSDGVSHSHAPAVA
jgi:hypothetical protein